MGMIVSQITSLTIVYSTVYSDADQRKHQSSASQAFVQGIHRGPVNSPHKWPVTWKMFPYDDVIIWWLAFVTQNNTMTIVILLIAVDITVVIVHWVLKATVVNIQFVPMGSSGYTFGYQCLILGYGTIYLRTCIKTVLRGFSIKDIPLKGISSLNLRKFHLFSC